MSLSSKMRKQRRGSYASQAMHHAGILPGLGNDRSLDDDLLSHRISENKTDIVSDYEEIETLIADAEHQKSN